MLFDHDAVADVADGDAVLRFGLWCRYLYGLTEDPRQQDLFHQVILRDLVQLEGIELEAPACLTHGELQ